MQAVDVLAVVEDKKQAEAKHGHDVSRQRQEEEEEVAVVPPADAVVHPRTVVVEVLHDGGWKDTVVNHLTLLLFIYFVLFSSVACVVCFLCLISVYVSPAFHGSFTQF